MLVLTLRPGEPDDGIEITTPSGEKLTLFVQKVWQGQVEVCFDGPRHFEILRKDATVREPEVRR